MEFTRRKHLYQHSTKIKTLIFAIPIVLTIVIILLALLLKINYIFIAFILLFHYILLLMIGRFVINAILFPYSNKLITTILDGQLNDKFGTEYVKILRRTQQYIKTYMLQKEQSNENAGQQEIVPFSVNQSKKLQLIYSFIFLGFMTTCELINLYQEINQKCIQEAKKDKRKLHIQFQRITKALIEIKEILKQLQVVLKSQQNKNKPAREVTYSFWNIYSNEIVIDVNDITMLYEMPNLPQIKVPKDTDTHMNKLDELIGQFEEQFTQSIKPCCKKRSCFIFYKKIFGTIDQMRFMLEKNFDGRHFYVETKDKETKIDCMFFPSSSEEVIAKSDKNQNKAEKIVYTDSPTILMCNPNALFYHHMVNAPNAFWLNFFLKKGINVMAWNSRGYGRTQGSPSPYNLRTDGEQMLWFMIDELQLKGKIGVYGRSLGGIVATHLANKYSDKIQFLFADRTFGNLEEMSKRKLNGYFSSVIYDIISFKWESRNDINFFQAQCFKVTTCDPKDDVVDEFSSLSTQVAKVGVKKLQNFILYSVNQS